MASGLPGVDVSSFQGPPGEWVAAAGDIDWAAVKLTELQPNGTRYVNPDAQADWDWLHAHGKGRIGYLFGHPATSAAESVSFFLNEINKIGLRDSDAVCLDLEVTDGYGPAHVSAWADQVQSELKSRIDRPPVLYTFIDFAREGNCACLSGTIHCGSPIRRARVAIRECPNPGRRGPFTNMTSAETLIAMWRITRLRRQCSKHLASRSSPPLHRSLT